MANDSCGQPWEWFVSNPTQAPADEEARVERFLWIGVGGALGTWTRYLVGLWAGERLGTTYPWGTFLVNVTGCFLIGLVMHLSLHVASFPPTLRFALTTGFMGGLTTYSSFNYETLKLAQDGAWGSAALNFGLTTFACFAAGLLGLALGTRFTTP